MEFIVNWTVKNPTRNILTVSYMVKQHFRWRNSSIVRDTRRLRKSINQIVKNDLEVLTQAHDWILWHLLIHVADPTLARTKVLLISLVLFLSTLVHAFKALSQYSSVI